MEKIPQIQQISKTPPKKRFNILFIIGNGFDLGLGMKTRYADMYDSYISSPSRSDTIRKFKEYIANDEKYNNWSDFEMAMARHAYIFNSENEFIECMRDFKKHMVAHLQAEYESISKILEHTSNDDLKFNMLESLQNFEAGLIPNHLRTVQTLKDEYPISFSFLSFNYTYTLDTLLRRAGIGAIPLHIHGTLDNDVVLGVDGEQQIKAKFYETTRKTQRAFVKPKFNEAFDTERLEKAKNMIMSSDMICSYGFSYGESDRMWLDLIAQWLMVDERHHLISFQYDNNSYDKFNSDILMETEEEKKQLLFYKLFSFNVEEDSPVFDQIHIPVGFDIFNFEFVENKKAVASV